VSLGVKNNDVISSCPTFNPVDFSSTQHGSLAVAEGRDIAPHLNHLLSLPFHLKIATKDFHPQDHISFASNHPPPDNTPFVSTVKITNPLHPTETQETRLWPDHCVQGTLGAELLPELDASKLHHVIEKGQDQRVEMYSAFADPFLHPVAKSQLADILKGEGITHVYVGGLAMDYCVKCTALDAAKEGFEVVVIEEATRAVDPGAWEEVRKEMKGKGVRMVRAEGEEVTWVKHFGR